MRGWRRFGFGFMSREAQQGPAAASDVAGNNAANDREAAERPPRRGEVRVLAYGTLDDQAMHRLRGRSDHRPVVGSYAVYV